MAATKKKQQEATELICRALRCDSDRGEGEATSKEMLAFLSVPKNFAENKGNWFFFNREGEKRIGSLELSAHMLINDKGELETPKSKSQWDAASKRNPERAVKVLPSAIEQAKKGRTLMLIMDFDRDSLPASASKSMTLSGFLLDWRKLPWFSSIRQKGSS